MKRAFDRRAIGLVLLAMGIGVGLRLYLAACYYGNYDQQSFEIVAGIVRRGGNVYAETHRYNYSPLWSYCLLALSHISEWSSLEFHFVVRAFATVVDLADAALIALLAGRVASRKMSTAFAFYLLNPVAILLTGFHGQFENLALLPLLAGTYLCTVHPKRPPGMSVWLLGTLAILVKHITAFGVWMLFVYAFPTRRRALGMAVLSMMLFSASFLPYLSEGAAGIIANVLLYSSLPGVYGIGMLLPPELSKVMLVVVLGLLPFLSKDRLNLSLVRAMELSTVTLLALIPGFGVQYLIMPVVLGSVSGSVHYFLYSGAGAVYLLTSRYNLALMQDYPWVGLSALFVLMTVNLVWPLAYARRRRPAEGGAH